MNVCTLAGARPNFVKIVPILTELRHYPKLESRLIHTGQHYDYRIDRIHYVGNVMIDALPRWREHAAARSRILAILGVRDRAFAVLTLHRPSNVDDSQALRRTLAAIACVRRDLPVICPLHSRTRERLDALPASVRGGRANRQGARQS